MVLAEALAALIFIGMVVLGCVGLAWGAARIKAGLKERHRLNTPQGRVEAIESELRDRYKEWRKNRIAAAEAEEGSVRRMAYEQIVSLLDREIEELTVKLEAARTEVAMRRLEDYGKGRSS